MKTALKRRYISAIFLAICEAAVLGAGSPRKISDLPKDTGWGESVLGCKLGCAPTTQPFKTGEPIDIHVMIGNFGKSDEYVPLDHGLFWCTFKVTDKDGKDVPLTRNGLPNNGENPNVGLGPVGPGLYFGRNFRLNEIFDFSVPGEYKVEMTMDIYDFGLNAHSVTYTTNIKVDYSYKNFECDE